MKNHYEEPYTSTKVFVMKSYDMMTENERNAAFAFFRPGVFRLPEAVYNYKEVDKLVETYQAFGGECHNLYEGNLQSGDWILFSEDEELCTFVVWEAYLNCWESVQVIRRYIPGQEPEEIKQVIQTIKEGKYYQEDGCYFYSDTDTEILLPDCKEVA